MKKFTTSYLNNIFGGTPPPFGSTPPPGGGQDALSEAKYCFHFFWIDIRWDANSDTIGTGGLNKLGDEAYPGTDFGGSVLKACLCLTLEQWGWTIGRMDDFKFPMPPDFKSGPLGVHVRGFMLSPSIPQCPCKANRENFIPTDNSTWGPPVSNYTDCGGFSEDYFEVLGRDGRPLKINPIDPFWVSTTGEAVFLRGNTRADILREILNWEMTHPMKCCKKKS